MEVELIEDLRVSLGVFVSLRRMAFKGQSNVSCVCLANKRKVKF